MPVTVRRARSGGLGGKMLLVISLFLALLVGASVGGTANANTNGALDQLSISTTTGPIDRGLDVCPICHTRICLLHKDELDPSGEPTTPPFSGLGRDPLKLVLRLFRAHDSPVLRSAQRTSFSPRGPPPIA